MIHPRNITAVLLALMLMPAFAATNYVATWDSVNQHPPAPEWFQDAKFGIYFHWGVFSVPAYDNEWYPRTMYNTASSDYSHHLATFGNPVSSTPPPFWPFDYFITGKTNLNGVFTQFAPKLASQGGNFDPDAWAQLFVDAGAKFAGPVAEHHDGYSMWSSAANEWNSVSNGPHLDLAQIFATAIRAKGLKFLMAMHHAYHMAGYYEYVPPQTNPSLKKLYAQMGAPAENQLWYDKLKEIIDDYQPDIIYQDFDLVAVNQDKLLNFLSYYYNSAQGWNREVVATYKDAFNTNGEVYDYERGGPADISAPYWLTDDSISSSSWCYTVGIGYYATNAMLHALIDRVSKNGNMVLNIAPMADGTIPQAQKNILLGLGDWLGRFGESIYSTRAWTIYGEGPTAMGGGSFVTPVAGTSTDIRFTRNKTNNVLYAIVLGWPGAQINLGTLNSAAINLSTLTQVQLLGATAGSYISLATYTQDAGGLKITLPAQPYTAMAYVLKLTFAGAIPEFNPTFAWSAPVKITTADATLNQPGSPVGAAAFNGSAITVTLASGTNIVFKTDGSVATCTGSGTATGAFAGDTGNANFNSVLSQFKWDGGPHTITLKGLIPGQFYSVQLFALDNRSTGGIPSRQANYQAPNNAQNISATVAMSDNVYVMGTFTANSTNAVIKQNLPVGNTGNFNALVVRKLSLPGLRITAQPQSVNTWPGQNTQFAVKVSANSPVTYQWQAGAVGGGVFANLTEGGNISGTTNATLSLSGVTTASTADLRVVITNPSGSVTSSVAKLSVLPRLFQWSAPMSIGTADDTLNQPGKVVGATVFGATSKTVTLSNGTNIVFLNDSSVASVADANSFGGGSGVATGAFSGTTGNANFDAVLTQFSYDGGPKTITLKNLVVGQSYSVQLFALDNRVGGSSFRQASYQDPNDANNVSASFDMGDNVYVMGTFVAPANGANTNVNVVIQENLPTGSGYGNLNALVIRAITPAVALNFQTAPAGQLQLQWSQGTLLEATNLNGTWVTNLASSPLSVTTTGDQKFFRLRIQ